MARYCNMLVLKTLLAIAAIAGIWTWGTSVPPLAQASENLSPDAQQRLTRAVAQLASEEPNWRREAQRMFPGDAWSQGDHFGNVERGRARALASRQGVSLRTVLRAIDDDIHLRRAGQSERGRSAVCVPRPFYD